MLKIRQSHDCLIFNMGIHKPEKDSLYIEPAMIMPADALAPNGHQQTISRLNADDKFWHDIFSSPNFFGY